MPDNGQTSLEKILDRIQFALREPIDFTTTDTATTLAKVRLLTAAATYFNTLAVTDFGAALVRPAKKGWWSR